jgi:hypothetical protein
MRIYFKGIYFRACLEAFPSIGVFIWFSDVSKTLCPTLAVAVCGLVLLALQPILDRSRSLLQKILPVEDFATFSALSPSLDEIYVPIAQVDDENLLLDLVFDVVLKANSTCPPHFEPVNPDIFCGWSRTFQRPRYRLKHSNSLQESSPGQW